MEDRQAVLEHIAEVRKSVLPALMRPNFPDAARFLRRFDRVVDDWACARSDDAGGVIEALNEAFVVRRLLDVKGAASARFTYEPRVTATGKSIDLLLQLGDAKHYFDIKTIRPREPDARRSWSRYKEARPRLTERTDIVLEEEFSRR
jgi:hypothetical protein